MSGSEHTYTRRTWMRRTAMGLALVSTLSLTACDGSWNPMQPKAVQFNAIDITGASYAKDFSLPDATGRIRSMAEFKGKVVFVFFGFTQCPDVCPTTMAELAQVRKQLGPQADLLQGVFITLDPERDSSTMLRDYAQGMDPSFLGLRGSPEQTAELAKSFKIFYQKVPSPSGEGYTIDHTAGAYVFDKQGQVRLFVRYGQGADKLLADIKTLLAER